MRGFGPVSASRSAAGSGSDAAAGMSPVPLCRKSGMSPLIRGLAEYAEAVDAFVAQRAQLVGRQFLELVEMTDEHGFHSLCRRLRIAVRAADGLRDDLVDEPQLLQAIGGHAHGL